jgi:hypothetical protein
MEYEDIRKQCEGALKNVKACTKYGKGFMSGFSVCLMENFCAVFFIGF